MLVCERDDSRYEAFAVYAAMAVAMLTRALFRHTQRAVTMLLMADIRAILTCCRQLRH